MKAKEPTNRPRTALTQPYRDAMQQHRDKGLPNNRSLTPRAEDGCTAEPQPWDHSAPAGTTSENLSESAARAGFGNTADTNDRSAQPVALKNRELFRNGGA